MVQIVEYVRKTIYIFILVHYDIEKTIVLKV
jgi:hypothetical protein